MTEIQAPLMHIPSFDQPWEKNSNSIWLATNMTLRRNVAKFNFSKSLDHEKRTLVSEMLLKALQQGTSYANMLTYEIDKLHPVDRDFFAEHFLLFEIPHEIHREQILVVDTTGNSAILINSLDHLELHAVETGHNLEKRFDQLLGYEQEIERQLPYAFSNHFGYLTADPIYAGTGLSVQAYLHIPGLCFLNKIDTYKEPSKLDDILYTSLQGDHDPLIGNILVLKNRYAIGVSEEAILSSIRNTALRVATEEQAAREKLMQKKDDAVYTAISRALGTLFYAYSMDTTEALHTLSLIKFGLEIDLLKGMSIDSINELFFDCRRGHLSKKIGGDGQTKEEIYKTRAQYLKKALTNVSLTY